MINTMFSIIAYAVLLVLVAALAAYGYNSLFAPKYSQSYDRVIFISGSYTYPSLLSPWRWYLQSRFPNAHIELISGYYGYRDTVDERASLVEMKNRVVNRLRNLELDTSVAVVAYSYGGVLLDAAYHELQRANHAPYLERVVTVASPIAGDELFIDQDFINSRAVIGFSHEALPSHRIICGKFDALVTCDRAKYSPQQDAVSTWSNHYTFMLPQVFAGRDIIEELVKEE